MVNIVANDGNFSFISIDFFFLLSESYFGFVNGLLHSRTNSLSNKITLISTISFILFILKDYEVEQASKK